MRAGFAEAAAVGERALSKHVHVTRFVHRLRREEHFHFEEVVIHLPHPSRRRVGRDEFHLGEEGAQLAHRALEVVGQRLEFGPRDVARGAPLARDRLFVQLAHVVGPALGLFVDGEAERGQVVGNHGAARRHRAMRSAVLGDDSVAADFDVLEAQAEVAGLGAHAPFAHLVHPAEVGSAGFVELLQVDRRLEFVFGFRTDPRFILDMD